jgi:hypothetical protein
MSSAIFDPVYNSLEISRRATGPVQHPRSGRMGRNTVTTKAPRGLGQANSLTAGVRVLGLEL